MKTYDDILEYIEAVDDAEDEVLLNIIEYGASDTFKLDLSGYEDNVLQGMAEERLTELEQELEQQELEIFETL